MKVTPPSESARPRCFIAMPVTTHERENELYGDADHWLHVMDSLFARAITAAGYEVVKPVAQGSHLIHEVIIQHLEQCELVLCDLSAHNPNVFFELGVRTSLNKPIALVRDEYAALPFDTSGINTHSYKSALRGWEMDSEVEALTTHIQHADSSCRGENPLWRKFGLTLKAMEPLTSETPTEAKLDLMLSRLPTLESELAIQRERNVELMMRLQEFENVMAPIHRGPDVKGFLAAADRYKSKDGTPFRLLALEDTGLVIGELSRMASPDDQARVQTRLYELASRYGVHLEVDANQYRQARVARTLDANRSSSRDDVTKAETSS